MLAKKDAATANIDSELDSERRKKQSQVKLLLLGTGESGKSTVAKQLKILHLDGFSKDELAHYKTVLESNIIGGMSRLVEQAPKMGYTISSALASKADFFTESEANNTPLTPAIAADIKALWADPAIQATYERRAEFQLHGSLPYIMENIDRLADPAGAITQDDVLQCRVRTTGIIEIDFPLESYNFRVMDVGGQRSERKKWINCFDDVTAVIFCVALSEYDEKLVEDIKVNRMEEALTLFGETANHKAFSNSSIVLFLNKSDLFRDKIAKVPLVTYFPDYKGGNDFDKGTKFLTQQFLKKVEDTNKLVFPHVTCATDTENVRVVFKSVRTSILQQSMKGLYF